MNRIMWSQAESLYRGQSLTGTVITIDEDALNTALKHAGNTIFDTEWWLETLTVVLERWGLRSKEWTDPTTQVLRVHIRTAASDQPADTGVGTGPLTTRLLISGGLDASKVGSGGLSSGKLNNRR
jgi:hypothetical protein